MFFQELYNSLISKLDSFLNMDSLDVYLCLVSIECLKEDLAYYQCKRCKMGLSRSDESKKFIDTELYSLVKIIYK